MTDQAEQDVATSVNSFLGRELYVYFSTPAAPREEISKRIKDHLAYQVQLETEGKLFAAGQAGERFAVRNSGAEVVVEGCGSNGCEYMTNGIAVILGPVGHNFGAGMTGGMAFVYDSNDSFVDNVNDDTVVYQRIQVPDWEKLLKRMVEQHARETQSGYAAQLLREWDQVVGHMRQVVPKDMLGLLDQPLTLAEAAAAGAAE